MNVSRLLSDNKRGGARYGLITVLTLLILSMSLQAQNYSDTLSVYFRQGKSTFDRAYEGNGQRADAFVANLRSIIDNRTQSSVTGIQFIISCSPEGSREFNNRLVKARTANLLSWMRRQLPLDGIPAEVSLETEPWGELLELVEADAAVPMREEVISILSRASDVYDPKAMLMELGGGEPWRYLLEHQFVELRRFEMIVCLQVRLPDASVSEEELQEFYGRTQLPLQVPVQDFSALDSSVPTVRPLQYIPGRKFYIKTNVLALGMLVQNVCAEMEIPGTRLSVNIPVYYSGLDWFHRTSKFRILGVLPELRYNFDNGLYLGAHAGLAWYNFAFGGDWRYQDAGGDSPAWGGGLNIGYRITPFKSVPRLGLEFNAGVGVYSLRYDKFYNEINGPLAQGGIQEVKLIPDTFGVSIYYKFGAEGGRVR